MIFVLSSRLKLILVCWMIAEGLVFVGAVKAIGIGGTLLLGLLASLLGAWQLKRMGTAAAARLRGAVSGRTDMPGTKLDGSVLDGTVRALAALALLLPGFLSDAVGLALCVPPVRAAAVRRLRGRSGRHSSALDESRRSRGRHGPDAIDLSPEEWSSAGPPSPR